MVFKSDDATEQAASGRKEKEEPQEQAAEPPSTEPQWKRVKPYYVLMLVYALVLFMGLIFRLCS